MSLTGRIKNIANKLLAISIVAIAYAANVGAIAYVHRANVGNMGDFTFSSTALLEAGMFMLLSHTLVLLYWMICVDLSTPVNPNQDVRQLIIRKLLNPFLFVRWLSISLYVGSRKKNVVEKKPKPKDLREAIVHSIDRDCIIADILLLIAVPFVIGHPGLYSIPYRFSELETAWPREAVTYMLLLAWFNALAQILLSIFSRATPSSTEMENPKRDTLKTLFAFVGSILLGGWQQRAWATTDNSAKKKGDARLEERQARELERLMREEEIKAQLRDAEEREAQKVEQLYSTKPHRFRMAGREYLIPVNYFTPKGRDNPDGGESKGFGFFLFLPDYGGYTKENWRDPFDRRRIDVVQVEPVEKNAMGKFTDGTRRPLSPDRFDPRKRFERTKSRLEDKGIELYGLVAYRNKGGGATPGAVWTGTRSNGEFFFFRTSLAPGESAKNGYPSNPLCDVRYYSEKEDLSIVYTYSLNHIAKWREIDDAIWEKLHSWRVR